jgi:hypothetical protein
VTGSDLVAALEPVAEAFEALGVAFYVGGSAASAVHGMPRSSLDVDVIADLGVHHVAPLVARLQGAYYVDEGRVRAAVDSRRSFNVIHLATMFKVDVFVAKRRPFDREVLRRSVRETLHDASDARPFPVASPEDTILAKLEWFRSGGEVSDRQWADIVSILRLRRSVLDYVYLKRWAADLRVGDLLEKAEQESASGRP